MKKVFEVILLIIIVVCALCSFALSTQVSGYRGFIVLSGSMEPLIPTGAVVFTKRISPSTLHIGDIITFISPTRNHEFITHRIVNITNKKDLLTFDTKGDKNKSKDTWILTQGGVVGKVVYFVPEIGYALSFISSKLGLVLLILLPSVYIFLEEVKNIVAILKNWKKKTDTPTIPCLIVIASGIIFIHFQPITYTHGLLSSSVAIRDTVFTVLITPKPTATPTCTPTPTKPTPTPSPCDNDTDINISGNGAGSENKVTSINDCENTINESSQNTTVNDVTTNNNTGDTISNENTGGATTISITTKSGSNSATAK
jgi:signal peptidase